MKFSFRTKLIVGFISSLVVLGFFSWKLQQVTKLAAQDSQWVTHTHEVLESLGQVLATMVDIETGQRGFVITKREEFLEPFQSGTLRISQLIQQLRTLTADNPVQQRNLDTLEGLIRSKINFADEVIHLQKDIGSEAAIEKVRMGTGKRSMDQIRQKIEIMRAEENRLLASRRAEAATSNTSATFMTYFSLSLVFALLLLLFLSVQRYPAVLEKSNRELEEQVRKRTGSLAALTRLYATLSQVNQTIVRTKSRSQLFESICKVAIEFSEFRLAWIGLFDTASGDVMPVAISSKGKNKLPFETINAYRSPFKEGLVGTALKTGSIAFSNDIQADPHMHHWHAAALENDYHSAVAVPFRLKGQVVGLLNLYAAEVNYFMVEEERRLFEEMSLDISFALDAFETEAQRKRAEEELRTSEERLSFALQQSHTGGWELDLLDHTAHRTLEHDRIFGYDALLPEWTYEMFLEHVLPEDRAEVDRRFKEATVAQTDWSFECRIRRTDGKVRWIWAAGEHQRDAAGQARQMAGIVQDITERRRTEEALRQNEKHLRQIIDLVPHFIFAKDAEGQFILVNQAVADAYGTTVKELTGKSDADFAASEEEVRQFRTKDLEVINSGQPLVIPEETITDASGHFRILQTVKIPFEFSNSQPGVLGVSVDITERKRAEEAQRESEEQFRLISENVVDLIAVLDLDGKRVYNSPSYKPILGDLKSLRGTDSFQEIHPEDRDRIRQIFQETVKTGLGQRAEYRFSLKDGSIRFIESQGSVIRDGHGNTVRVVAVSRDVTERKQLEKQFLRAQRMESIGTLAGGIAHDLNNVLAPIMLSFDIISKKLPDEQSQKMLQMLQSTAKRGSDLIKQVLSFARGIEGERTLVQLRHLIDEIGKIINETFPKSISLRTDVPKNLATISADATQLHQVLMNLCVNARDAMPHGGTIDIKAETVMLDDQYVRMHSEAKPGLHVVMTVTDQGMGIPPGTMERIFEPFFTTKEIGKGTGLGLSTVLGIIKSHDGFVNVYSEVGKGTTFKVYLPAQGVGQAAVAEVKETLPVGNGELILVVDDEESIREITRTTLEAYGYSVITAADGTEAVASYATHREKIALVLTDMMMPYMDGAATIRAIQKLNPKVKVVAVSGLKQNGHNLTQEAVIFLHKPYTSEKLLNTIHEMLSRK